ncbi:MAG: CRISPR-associated helicase Cas3' [Capsulimonadaceae bacterium]|nr:CRISPR-associated helicase Cas3' [Capsulimonadaceae bacterium]
MVFDLIAALPSPFDRFRSHPDKLLREHVGGVMDGVRHRTDLPTALVAALFHDLGKLNPNFQPKLDGIDVQEYSSHAYLSARAFLAFCATNRRLRQKIGIFSDVDVFSVVHMVARHHGNLGDAKSILGASERAALSEFMKSQPALPISNYLGQWLEHSDFDVREPRYDDLLDKFALMPDDTLRTIGIKLEYFLKTQFGFACLVEADKRDAGNNKWFRRDDDLGWAREQFSENLSTALRNLSSVTPLNRLRTSIRDEAVRNVQVSLAKGERVFSLTSPTGSGKTFTLLAIADAIRTSRPDHSIIYSLPYLSITEQVEDVCRNVVFTGNPSFVTRVDSRSESLELEILLKQIESDPSKTYELLSRSFSIETFDAAFIVTTFVQFFETLLSNRGATLLRLPNFSKSIFLVDELQALPQRLYTFFAAYLQAFCELFDSFAVLSTATMPALCLPDANVSPEKDARKLFPCYRTPRELLSFEKYYGEPAFNRYRIQPLTQDRTPLTLDILAKAIQHGDVSSLIILNRIDDTQNLYRMLSMGSEADQGIILLNTHFILNDRREKIEKCKQRLKEGKRTILISTQLIEAGVDIDFPCVYRDLCPLPNLIQSSGRCNRNGGLLGGGVVYFFELRDEQGKSRAETVYRDPSDRWILDFSRQAIHSSIPEADLLSVQRAYFDLVNSKMQIGNHRLLVGNKKKTDNLIQRINEAAFEIVGSFRLIDEKDFGADYQFYVPQDEGDRLWEDLGRRLFEFAKTAAAACGRLPFAEIKRRQLAIDDQLRRMSGRVVQVRAFDERTLPPSEMRNCVAREICGVRKLALPEIDYSSDTGIKLNGAGHAII